MSSKIISIFILILFASALNAHSEPSSKSDASSVKSVYEKKVEEEENEEPSYRLPSAVVPKRYKINLKPYLDDVEPEKKFTFDGSVEIQIEIEAKVPEIIIHARDLNFTPHNTILKKINDSKVEEEIQHSLDRDKSRDFVLLRPVIGKDFAEGSYSLTIEKFSGVLNDEMRGFYRSSYVNEKGETVYLATTHFEPVGARRAFPCFDEPHLKATFELSIQHPANYNAISNMPAIITANSSQQETVFKPTLLMSTYLLAFVVSDFKSIGEDRFRVHAKPTAIQRGQLALQTGEKLLRELEAYTDLKFDLPKMDQIAIPDFAAGAMENWGLVTYREKSLLYDNKTSSTAEKQNIVETIAHEFAHQWFGDLVSPQWWKFLWLNEGFANFFQSYITEQVEPTWQSIHQSVIKSIQTTAFDFDSSDRTHPINQPVESPEEISAIFDSISYQKAGAVIRMMQHFLGNDVFKRGLNIYLTKNKLKSANSSDLFRGLDDAVREMNVSLEQKLEIIMDAWVNRKGYPVVTVTRDYKDSKQLKIEQKRFFSYNSSAENEEAYYWRIPINYATTKNQDFGNTSAEIWLSEPSKIVHLSVEPDEWVILNKQQTGFYRVNYDERNWQLIISYLNSEKRNSIHVLNRAQLMNDALAFAKQGSLSLSTFLNLTSYLSYEIDYVSWYPGFKSLSWLKEKIAATDHFGFFKEYALDITRMFVESIGFDESKQDGHVDKLKRVQAIHWSCSLGNKTCANHVRTKLEHWIEQPQMDSLSPDLKQVTLCEGLRTASFDLWKKVFNKCLNLASDDEKSQLASALTCSNDKTILQYYLNYTVELDSKLNDTLTVTRNIRDNSEIGVDAVLDFVIKRFITLVLKYKDENHLINMFSDVGEKITTKSHLDRLKATKDADIPTRITAKAIQAAEKNIAWLEQNEKILTDWLEEVRRKYGHNGVSTLNVHIGLTLSLSFLFFVLVN